MKALVNIQEGKTLDDSHCFNCDSHCCMYNNDGICIYNIATIQVRTSRACYEDLRMDEIEARLDYEDGNGI